MTVAANQDKENNEKTGKTEAGEEKTVDRFQRGCMLLFAVIQRAAQEKRGLYCIREVPRVIKRLGKFNSHFDPTQTWSETAPPTTMLRQLLIGIVQ